MIFLTHPCFSLRIVFAVVFLVELSPINFKQLRIYYFVGHELAAAIIDVIVGFGIFASIMLAPFN